MGERIIYTTAYARAYTHIRLRVKTAKAGGKTRMEESEMDARTAPRHTHTRKRSQVHATIHDIKEEAGHFLHRSFNWKAAEGEPRDFQTLATPSPLF